MKALIMKKPANERFNNLCVGDTLEQFEWFEIMPCRNDQSEGCTIQCDAGSAEFWSIYGRRNVGAGDAPEFLALAVHDETQPITIVRIARQIAEETGKGFVAGCGDKGQYPRRNGRVVPVTDFCEIAEDLTMAIHEDIEADTPEEDRRVDDFDNHPLAELREAFVDFSSYSGSDERNPYVRRMVERCKACGSDDIRCDAVAEWDSDTGGYVLVDTYDTSWCNGGCDGEECSTAMFDTDSGEELKRGPYSPEYLPKAEADAAWDQYSRDRQEEAEKRKLKEQQEAKVDEISAVLAEAQKEIAA